MTAGLVSLSGAIGVYLLYTATAFGWRRIGPSSDQLFGPTRSRITEWLVQAGLAEVAPLQFGAATAFVSSVGALCGYLLFGDVVPALAGAAIAGAAPAAAYRSRRIRIQDEAREAWPRMIEEIRLRAGGLGRSIPQALFEVGMRGPDAMRGAFARAEREWLVSTDLRRALETLKAGLADPAADMVCETLLVAYEVGSGSLDERLRVLVEDRLLELEGRRDAQAKQAGARFARRFVLFVPLGMAGAGLAIGNGRASYDSAAGQVAVAAALVVLFLCWVWAGRLMRMPEPERVFGMSGPGGVGS